MRIAMLSVHTCPLATLGGKETGGMNVYVRDLARELGRQGIGVDVFTRSQDEHEPHLKHDLGFGNRVFHIPAGPERPLPRLELFQYLPEFVGGVRLAAALLDTHYDVIHSHYWMSGWVAHELQRWWKVPMVHMAHTLGVMKNRIALRPEEHDPQLRLDVEQEILGWADRLIAATPAEEAQLQWLMRADPKKIEIIPPGVDLSIFHPEDRTTDLRALGLDPHATLLLFVGRIEPLKGADTLLKAIKILCDQHQLPANTQVALIGGEPNEPEENRTAEMNRLLELRKSLNLDYVVTFLGKRAQESLHYYYNAASAVVMPSHYESFGMVALEAMACGTPVIASNVGGLAYLVRDGETGFLVPDRDPQALAERLRCLLNDPALADRLGKQAAQYAQQYRWSAIAQQMQDVYTAVLATKPVLA
ncbi:MAG TPA: glycosyltransferase [Anaerolineales bacterium]|nr:glycosyltransferase [Anaerolineales bacterium]